jgi:hypothetical protein
MGFAGPAQAQLETLSELARVDAPGHWRWIFSPGMVHYNPSPEHRHVWAMGAERQRDDQWLYGFSYFSNSFGQDSGYLYVGSRYPGIFGRPPLYFQWTAGLLYGYRGSFKDKVPLNYRGFSPGAVLSLGWQFDRHVGAAINLVGTAGAMLQVSYDWP